MAKQIMVRTSDNPPVFMEALAMEYVGPNGQVYLTEPIQLIDGTSTTVVPTTICFEFDAFLIDECNRMVGQAMDMLIVVQHLIDLRARPAFDESDENDWISDLTEGTPKN